MNFSSLLCVVETPFNALGLLGLLVAFLSRSFNKRDDEEEMRSDGDNENDRNASFLSSGETLKASTRTTTRKDEFLHHRNKELFVVEYARRFVNAKSTSNANKDSTDDDTKDDDDAKVSSILSSRGGGDGDDDDIFFFDALYSSVHESVQRLLESEALVVKAMLAEPIALIR